MIFDLLLLKQHIDSKITLPDKLFIDAMPDNLNTCYALNNIAVLDEDRVTSNYMFELVFRDVLQNQTRKQIYDKFYKVHNILRERGSFTIGNKHIVSINCIDQPFHKDDDKKRMWVYAIYQIMYGERK